MTDTTITIDILTYFLPQSDSALQIDLAITAQDTCNVAIQADVNDREADDKVTIKHLEKGIHLHLTESLEPGQGLTVRTAADHDPFQGDHVTFRTAADSARLFLEEVDVSRGTNFYVSITPQAIIPALDATMTIDDCNCPLVGIQS
jgi:hypothetical protein